MSRTLVHLSDLHFGTVPPGVAECLWQAVRDLNPDIVVISGDLTQRARPMEFIEARAFIDRLPGHVLVVPGNHDVPLYNLVQRFTGPLKQYEKYISSELEPDYVDSEIAVLGINTARSLTWKGGRVNAVQVNRVGQRMRPLRPEVIRIVVTHHPFDVPTGHSRTEVVGRAHMAMSRLAASGADILLSGHLHKMHIGDTVRRYNIDGHAALVIQAGTASSGRRRGEQNAFNCLYIDGNDVAIEQWLLEPGGRFGRSARHRYRKAEGSWVGAISE